MDFTPTLVGVHRADKDFVGNLTVHGLRPSTVAQIIIILPYSAVSGTHIRSARGFEHEHQKDAAVSGYQRSDGISVDPYFRTQSDSTDRNNYSTKPKLNPHTGNYPVSCLACHDLRRQFSTVFVYRKMPQLITEAGLDPTNIDDSSLQGSLAGYLKVDEENEKVEHARYISFSKLEIRKRPTKEVGRFVLAPYSPLEMAPF